MARLSSFFALFALFALALSPAFALAGDAPGTPSAVPAKGGADAEATAAPAVDAGAEPKAAETLEELAAEADRLWLKRGPGFGGKANIAMTLQLEQGLAEHPKSFELLWRLARTYWWRGDGSDDKKVKSAWGQKAMEMGDKARAIEPKRVEGHYFAAIGVGAWAQGMGIAKALWKGIDGKYNERLDTAIKIDENFDCGGPMLAKGRYFHELPWPKHDADASIEWLSKVLKVCPTNPRGHLFLADTLHAEDDDDPKAKEHLDLALKATRAGFSQDPGAVGRVIVWAKRRVKAWE